MQVKDVVSKLNLGTAKQTLAGTKNSPLELLMLGLHQEIVDQLTASADSYGVSASNRLKQSIVTIDQSSEGVIGVGIEASFYWKYVNFGVNGTKVNHGAPTWGAAPSSTLTFKQAILEWIRDKGLTAKPGQTYDQMAFAIMRGIREKGITPRPFVTEVINKQLTVSLTKSISEVLGKAIKIHILEPWQ
jgi:hypothetical protein